MLGIGNYIPTDKICIFHLCSLAWQSLYNKPLSLLKDYLQFYAYIEKVMHLKFTRSAM